MAIGPEKRRSRVGIQTLSLSVAALLLVVGCATAPAPTAAPTPAPSTPAAPAAPAEPQTPEELLVSLNKLSPAERTQRLVDGAKKEGKVVVYGTTNTDEAEAVFKVFREKYPFISTELVRASTGDLLTRTLNEARAGKLGADVIDFPAPELYLLAQENVVAKYVSPERAGWDPKFHDTEGFWTAKYIEAEIIGINTKFISKADAPKNFEELADPKWKGKLGRTSLGARWIAGMVHFYGEEKGMDLVKRIALQDPVLNSSNTAMGTMLASGEAPIVFDLHMSAIGREQKKGAPVDYILTDPLFAHMNGVSLSRTTSRPHAAALMIDFLLSKEGQETLSTVGTRTGGRKDVTTYANPELLELKNLVLYSPEISGKEYDKYQGLFEQLYVRGVR